MQSFCGGAHGLALRVFTGIVGDELSESSWGVMTYTFCCIDNTQPPPLNTRGERGLYL